MTAEGSGGVRLLVAVIGFWILMRAINRDSSGRTLIDHLLGQSGTANQAIGTGGASGAGRAVKGQTNPIPGATASRLDQGIDVTTKQILAPFTGKVVASQANSAGWKGGGYLAIQSAADPSKVEFFAEGLLPTVQTGQTVQAGQTIATPALNPYNSIIGNIETGPANPRNPLQPLAQVAGNPRQAVLDFYHWLQSLGGPTATSTSLAGHP